MKADIMRMLAVLGGKKVASMQIFVTTIDDELITVDVEASDLCDKVKSILMDRKGFKLSYAGKKLETGRPLSDYNIQSESTVFESMHLDAGGITTGKGCPILAALSAQHRCRRFAPIG